MAKVEMELPNGDELHEKFDPKPANQNLQKPTVEKKTVGSKLRDTFLSEETGDVGRYILFDVLIPSLKDAVADMITGAVNMIFYGDKDGRTAVRRDKDRSYVSYSSYYKREEDRNRRYSQQSYPSKSLTEDYYTDTRDEAEQIIEDLIDIIDSRGKVELSKFKIMMNAPTDYTDERYGWTNLSGAYARYIRHRDQYQICLPKPVLLN